ncbi:hypothetical protein KJI95_03290 [Shewanella sp. JM162201]|uniref:Uncharacterized protein n=1 Tax=Shewanella jiangmenensis TaxID=2837387 RepID=A0ABS5V1A1_9GAMM|nr:hypothetical protein [Shewanella jiangmenensis]MBT1443546.1 hypothetical protein [Shewanella jiangmenensis]
MPPRHSSAAKANSVSRANAKRQLLENTYQQLKSRQSLYKTALGSLLGAVAALILFALLAQADSGMLLLYLLPPLAIGFGARLLGRCFEWPLLLIPAALAAMVYGISFGWLLPFDSRDLIVIPIGIGLCFYAAKQPLNELQKQAIWQSKIQRAAGD